MENRTVLDILKKKIFLGSFAVGRILYSPLFGKCILKRIDSDLVLERKKPYHPSVVDTLALQPEGNFSHDGECMVYPSFEMRDWNKFAWENYTLLKSSNEKTFVFFDGWADDSYTKFSGILFRTKGEKLRRLVNIYDTSKFAEVDSELAKAFYVTLFFAVKHSLLELEASVPLYKEVVFQIHKQAFERSLAEFSNLAKGNAQEEKNAEGRAVLEKLSKNFSKNDSKPEFPTKGKLYYFENDEIADLSYLAVFDALLDGDATVHFCQALLETKNGRQYLENLKIKTKHCKNFRVATEEEIAKHKELISLFGNIFNKLETGGIYVFFLHDKLRRVGIFKGWSQDKSTLIFRYVVIINEMCRYDYQEQYSCKVTDILKLDFIPVGDRDKYLNQRLSNFQLYQFKPKDWCLMRTAGSCKWILCQFSHADVRHSEDINYVPVGGSESLYSQCIPYEGNEYLLGTTKTPVYGKKQF